jgi:ComF family protein
MAGLVHSQLQSAARRALDLLFPPLCIVCREPVTDPRSLCPDCWSAIRFLDAPMCASCGLPFEIPIAEGTLCAACHARPPSFDRARAVMRYDDASRGAILAFKHGDRLDLVPAFAHWLARTGADLISGAEVIVPVPLHRSRLWMRRFNQSAEIARALGKSTRIPVASGVLVRSKRTPSQGAMPSASARRRNVQGAFEVADGQAGTVAGRTILLVDDVLTTGSTVDACARALKRAGAARVYVLALARVVATTGVAI